MSSEMSSTCTEINEMPGEILMEFWSYLDFNTVQKICTRVSKSWLGMIRSSNLSWKMKLRDTRPGLLGVTDFNAILSRWQDLRELHFSSEQDFDKFRFSLKSRKSLEKIVIPSMIEFRTEWTSNDFPEFNVMTITKYWIDPKHLSTPLDEIKNVIELKIRYSVIHEEFAMRQNDDCDFTYLENLEFSGIVMSYDERSSVNFVPMLSRFKELKNLETGHLVIYFDYLLDILRFLGDMKNLKISVCLFVMNGLGEEATKEIFIKALEIVRKKFPFPDSRILKLEILEARCSKTKIGWKIYGESGAIARLILPDGSQYVLRDSEDEN